MNEKIKTHVYLLFAYELYAYTVDIICGHNIQSIINEICAYGIGEKRKVSNFKISTIAYI